MFFLLYVLFFFISKSHYNISKWTEYRKPQLPGALIVAITFTLDFNWKRQIENKLRSEIQ